MTSDEYTPHRYLSKEIIETCRHWADYHKDVIGEKWYKSIIRGIRRADKDFQKRINSPEVAQNDIYADTEYAAVLAFWLTAILSTFDIDFGYSIYTPFSPDNVIIPDRFDRERTIRLIRYCDEAFRRFSMTLRSQ